MGVFALKAIPAGTVIIEEKPVMIVTKRGGSRAKYANVVQTFERLSKSDQDKVMSLYHGHVENQNMPTIMGILQANCFGDDDAEQLYLLISRINHSCLPNATLEGGIVTSDRHIKAGEEIEIDYHIGRSDRMTARQRAIHFENDYGFKCGCPACGDTRFRTLSDRRRRMINTLQSRLEDFEPSDLNLPESGLFKMPDGSYQWVDVPERKTPLSMKLTIDQAIEYRFLLARLIEAEGLLPLKAATHYYEAVLALRFIQKRVMPTHQSPGLLIFLEPLRCVKAWFNQSLKIHEIVRGAHSS